MGRINGLRDQKREFASTLKGSVYGTFFGLAITIYVSLLISVLLLKIFTSMTEDLSSSAMNLLGDIFPTDFPDTYEISTYYVAAILTIHAILSSYLVKVVDGGNRFSMFIDLVYLLWMGAIIEISVTVLFQSMFSSYFG
jgi:flagellar protein FlaJ